MNSLDQQTYLQANRQTRLAGLCYLALVVTGIFSIMYVPSTLVVWESPAETVENLRSHVVLWRLGAAVELLCYGIYILLVLALYRLLHGVHQNAAVLMVVLAVASVPISMFAVVYKFNVIDLVQNPDTVFSAAQVEALMMQAFTAYGNGLLVAEVFWSTWLLPFGYLMYRSGFLPKWLGVLMMAGSVAYIGNTAGKLVTHQFAETIASQVFGGISSLAEIGTAFWLTIAGARKPKA